MDNFSKYESRSRGTRTRSNCNDCELIRSRRYNEKNRETKRIKSREMTKRKKEIGGDVWLRHVFNARLGSFRRESEKRGLPKLDIDASFLIDLYHKQGGKCFYSGETLLCNHDFGVQQKNSLSVDKKDPMKGYTEDNIVLCTYFMNTMKGALTTEQFQELIILLHERQKTW